MDRVTGTSVAFAAESAYAQLLHDAVADEGVHVAQLIIPFGIDDGQDDHTGAALAEQAGLSMAQMAVAWVLQNPNVSAAIVGASRPEQVYELLVEGCGLKISLLEDCLLGRDPLTREKLVDQFDKGKNFQFVAHR